MRRLLIGTCMVALALGGESWAGANSGAKMALDIRSHANANRCLLTYASCHSITSSYAGTGSIDVMVVVYEYEHFTAAEYAVEWPGSWTLDGFVSCADVEMTGTVGGNTLNVTQGWGNPEVAATDSSGVVVGYLKFTGTSTGQLKLKARTDTNFKGLSDSLFVLDAIPGTFTAQVGQGTGGDDPCQ